MRDVDAAYPAVGSALHHAVGAWPLLIRDDTTVEESDPPRRLVLMARAWPFGQARVTLEVAADPGGCLLTMKEEPVAGPGQWLHRMVQPVSEAALAHRNAECLDRLAAIIEHRNPALLPSAATS
jgi:hypothetical protein